MGFCGRRINWSGSLGLGWSQVSYVRVLYGLFVDLIGLVVLE